MSALYQKKSFLSASSTDEFSRDPARRLKVWRILRAEGVVEKKPIASYTREDFDQIDARILLVEMAERDGVSVDQMLDNWEIGRQTANLFTSIEDFMPLLRSDPDANKLSIDTTD